MMNLTDIKLTKGENQSLRPTKTINVKSSPSIKRMRRVLFDDVKEIGQIIRARLLLEGIEFN